MHFGLGLLRICNQGRGAAAGEYLIRIFVNIPYLAMFNIISETLMWVEDLSMLAICKGDTLKDFWGADWDVAGQI